MPDQIAPTVVDLFSGAGGLSVGFKWAGADIIHAVEEDRWAAATYALNFPEVPLTICDIRNISSHDIPALVGVLPDVVVGGPPCQGFSHSNTAFRDPKDPRNSLFMDFVRFADALRPRACLIENVKGLLSTTNHDGQPVMDIITTSFESIGYRTSFRVLDAADYGVPQRRERLIIVAIRGRSKTSFDWPEPSHAPATRAGQMPMRLFSGDQPLAKHVSLWQAISDLPLVTHRAYDAQESYRFEPETAYQRFMRQGAGPVIHNHEPMRHTRRVTERFSRIRYGESEEDVAQEFSPRRRGAPSRLSGRTYSQNSRRQHPDSPCNTIVASAHTNYIHPYLDRNFTVRETLRIQSFPDTFILKGKRAVLSRKLSERKGYLDDLYLDQRAQVGNAVPPLLAYALAQSLCRALGFPVRGYVGCAHSESSTRSPAAVDCH